MTKTKSTTTITKGLRSTTYPSNSGAVKRHEIRKRERVLHSGGTKWGSFPKERYD